MDMAVLFFVLFGVLALMGVQGRVSRIDKRVARVERKVDLILDHLGLRESDPRMDEVVALLRDDKKIQAIKLYREITGVGLKEAKDAVEQMA
ncbi:ribosomal protein L7/L12 [Streptomyces ferrugineus]|uniref:Ribosomal protein L7/L12 n=1 Tax=Streptomyces ferrugineus TaxID=1413221 RepID=A0A7M2SND1_9ACTN|nr:ribosomal protein L7/L12 [Streptomyces ferrugineus]QOV36983.1 ribosomal protein L7/L12 [Streptomyces ferrugineus]